MKSRSKLILGILAIILGAAVVLGYMWHTNRGFFQGSSISGLPDGHIRALETQPSHLDLLFSGHGGVEFNYFGEKVSVYLAYYRRDELVLHEIVANIHTIGDHELNGSMFWGLTTENNLPNELRVRLNAGGSMSQNYFDFSRLDFQPQAVMGSPVINGSIEQGRRYVLHMWQTGTGMRADGNVFDPEILRESENTAILYVIFE